LFTYRNNGGKEEEKKKRRRGEANLVVAHSDADGGDKEEWRWFAVVMLLLARET
jgi:hypothetical protein